MPEDRGETGLVLPDDSEVKNLLLVLSAPGMQVAAAPEVNQIRKGLVHFDSFCPLDIGDTLPTDPDFEIQSEEMPKDFYIFLPNDLNKLAKLNARFIPQPLKRQQ